MLKSLILLNLVLSFCIANAQINLAGKISSNGQNINGARVTLFNSDTTYFNEDRTNSIGEYLFSNIESGEYKIGVAKSNYNYIESNIIVNSTIQNLNFNLQT